MRGFKVELTTATQAAVRALVGRAQTEVDRLLERIEVTRVQGVTEVEEKRAALYEELEAMQQLHLAQDSRVELDVGGRRFKTSVATMRNKPGTMLDALFNGRHRLGGRQHLSRPRR